MNMPKIGINTGIILIALALLGYLGGGMESWTALIPAIAGAPILLSSLLAKNPNKLKLGMHIAATFGLLGFLAPLGRIIPTAIKGDFELKLSTGCMITMSLVSAIFMVQCIKSFKAARQARLKGL
ncbi:MAG: hypothetical protein L7U83_15085 [Akkermansiaceae bacterium]|jgi:hypothetical protein|nr:hypothetical protein [Akkermansiaceae bacterium]MDA7608959.1 hypothetical protein [Akkermansiaceae bacterium]MDC0188155.1 hypothetical protein [Verrucomicrobiota bacterium]HCN79828.1 hypothetical protein [Verrucomicrobiales bacterium]|tara:strand:- start:1779 stop:2153 length:375 start_codon:yes stop_codon:yes gene_type:complete